MGGGWGASNTRTALLEALLPFQPEKGKKKIDLSRLKTKIESIRATLKNLPSSGWVL
ncbi:hypothetical protein VB834_10480 [Limnoraphis robusta Tam1]|jgi:hypothetical protein|uniref:hypothetical protein n=1 Tax=Limnoraphis robusta TaxID=1118279 RepID=UPI001364C635|nr:hypothetical protein [Limnoraphis robusta]MEA5539460.1 hypothetical protein [Limnoraphis robusta Tam1]